MSASTSQGRDVGSGRSAGTGTGDGGPSGPGADTVPHRRWPRPTPVNLALGGVWLAGILFALLVPLAIVSPTETSPEPERVWLAFGATGLGILIFAAAGIAAYRRTANGSLLAWALIPGVSIGASGVIFLATLLSL